MVIQHGEMCRLVCHSLTSGPLQGPAVMMWPSPSACSSLSHFVLYNIPLFASVCVQHLTFPFTLRACVCVSRNVKPWWIWHGVCVVSFPILLCLCLHVRNVAWFFFTFELCVYTVKSVTHICHTVTSPHSWSWSPVWLLIVESAEAIFINVFLRRLLMSSKKSHCEFLNPKY